MHTYLKHLHSTAHADIKRPRVAGPSWSVKDLCHAYQWPSGLAGGGVIGIVELGGGWMLSDTRQFFQAEGLPMPSITDVKLNLANTNCSPRDPADGEVALDIQIAGASYAVATGKAATIRVYWTQDIASGVRAAAKDGCDVCSISWGSPEGQWPPTGPGSIQDMEQAAADAAMDGMVVFAAAGDSDSSDGDPSDPEEIDGPACCPHVIACGGTTKPASGEEIVWGSSDPNGDGTGGGFSKIFPQSPWLNGAPHGSGRMIPDMTACGDPATGYNIILYGELNVFGGTSCVGPLFAGLFAGFDRKLGFVGPTLWRNQGSFVDIVDGTNGSYRATPGPDPCSGIGRGIGTKLSGLFVKSPPRTM